MVRQKALAKVDPVSTSQKRQISLDDGSSSAQKDHIKEERAKLFDIGSTPGSKVDSNTDCLVRGKFNDWLWNAP